MLWGRGGDPCATRLIGCSLYQGNEPLQRKRLRQYRSLRRHFLCPGRRRPAGMRLEATDASILKEPPNGGTCERANLEADGEKILSHQIAG
jgi:hypothetical protein